ncbi:hypothetical protein NC651_033830 [Populus alba x Populus x berolinensis]|nr:hypothetical protein NC651_033830 [Populus alba x Populus x berolinensis]
MSLDGIKQNPVVSDLISKMAFHQNKVDVKFEWNARTQITMGYYDNTGGSKSSSRLWLLPQAFSSSSKRLLWSSGSYTFQILNTEFGKWPRFPVEGLRR